MIRHHLATKSRKPSQFAEEQDVGWPAGGERLEGGWLTQMRMLCRNMSRCLDSFKLAEWDWPWHGPTTGPSFPTTEIWTRQNPTQRRIVSGPDPWPRRNRTKSHAMKAEADILLWKIMIWATNGPTRRRRCSGRRPSRTQRGAHQCLLPLSLYDWNSIVIRYAHFPKLMWIQQSIN